MAAGALTDPAQAAGFMAAPRADCVAVSIGNVNTELRQAYLEATAATIGDVIESAHVAKLHAAQTAAVGRVVDEKLAVLARRHQARPTLPIERSNRSAAPPRRS